MNRFKLPLMAILFIGAISLSSCIGGGPETSVRTDAVSTGQELIDLKKAYDQGIITEKEYEKKKKQILKKK